MCALTNLGKVPSIGVLHLRLPRLFQFNASDGNRRFLALTSEMRYSRSGFDRASGTDGRSERI